MWIVTVAETYACNTEEMVSAVYGSGATREAAMLDAVAQHNTDRFEHDDEYEPLPLTEEGFYEWSQRWGTDDAIAVVNVGMRPEAPQSERAKLGATLTSDLHAQLTALQNDAGLLHAEEVLCDKARAALEQAQAHLDTLRQLLAARAS